jgi:allose kinase
LAVEIGGTNLRYAIISETFELVEFKKISTDRFADAEDKPAFLADLLLPWIERLGRDAIRCVSFALASLMDKERTTVYSSPMVRGFNNIPLKSELERLLQLPVILEKDVNALLLYEMQKLPEKIEGISCGIFIGTGLGNAICIGGNVYKGYSGTACELGHITVPKINDLCGCGKPGCIELLTCGNLLYKLATETYFCDVKKIFTLYGDRQEVKDIVYYAAVACAIEFTILDPELVVLGGGVTEMEGFPYEEFIQMVRNNLRAPNPRESIRFIRASGDAHAGVIGAAVHASQVINRIH